MTAQEFTYDKLQPLRYSGSGGRHSPTSTLQHVQPSDSSTSLSAPTSPPLSAVIRTQSTAPPAPPAPAPPAPLTSAVDEAPEEPAAAAVDERDMAADDKIFRALALRRAPPPPLSPPGPPLARAAAAAAATALDERNFTADVFRGCECAVRRAALAVEGLSQRPRDGGRVGGRAVVVIASEADAAARVRRSMRVAPRQAMACAMLNVVPRHARSVSTVLQTKPKRHKT